MAGCPVDQLVDQTPGQPNPTPGQPGKSLKNKAIAVGAPPVGVVLVDQGVDQLSTGAVQKLTGWSRQHINKLVHTGRLHPERVLVTDGPRTGREDYRFSVTEIGHVKPDALRVHDATNTANAALSQYPAPPIAPPEDPASVQSLKDWQRKRMDARLGVLRYVEKVEEELAAKPHPRWKFRVPTRDRAILLICADAVSGRLPEDIQALLPLANARAGQSGERTLSRRTLQRWAAEAKQGFDHLAPKAKIWVAPSWLPVLLNLYRQPQKPSLSSCVMLLAGSLPDGQKVPSIDAARRAMAKIGNVEREKGRMLPRELKSQKPFRRREKPEFPFDVLIADGHTFDAEVAHPLTGAPFRPEITTVVDVCTGRVVGWSAWEKECAWAVIDALRQAILLGGVPCIFYSDNGPGYVNGRMDTLKARLGFACHTGIPYNSQARGVIERLQKTLWVELGAKSFSTYVGASMDREARQIVFKATRKGMPILPSWQNFVAFMDQCVDACNARPSRGCPKALDEDGRKRHLSPAAFWRQHEALGWKPEGLPVTLEDFRPEEIRTVLRGEVSLFGNRYFSKELAELHKDQVRVAFDIHDASRIWIRTLDGELVCEAGFQANSTAYFPKPYVDQLREQRQDGQRKRLEAKAERVLGTLQGPVDIEELSPQTLATSTNQLRKLGIEDPEEVPSALSINPPSIPSERRRPFFKDSKDYALWILDHPDEADPEELAEIQQKLRKNSLYRTWLGREDAATA